MSPQLRPLQLPLLVEERRKREETQAETAGNVSYRAYSIDSGSSDAPSPVTPIFTLGPLLFSSSTSSFEIATSATSDSPASPAQSVQLSNKRVLTDVQEEPHEPADSDNDVDCDDDDALSDQFDLCNCLYDEPRIRDDPEAAQNPIDFYPPDQDIEYDLGCLSDSDFQAESLASRKRGTRADSIRSFSHRLGSRLPSLPRWRGSRQPSGPTSPSSEFEFEAYRYPSRAASSRSSSRSVSGRCESVVLPESSEVESLGDLCTSIQRERALATTPLLPPLMGDAHAHRNALPSPLESPALASPSPSNTEPRSPTIVSPPLSTQPSISSFRGIISPTDLPHIPEPDAWSDRLGHANFTILPQPYSPETSDKASLQQFHVDWDSARVNYTKHLARTGEHYGVNSKTYVLTEAKWAEIDRTWRRLHDDIAEAVVTSGVVAHCTQCDENVPTAMPDLNAEGKFPDRGDEDIIGPMVRQPTMADDATDRKRPSFWRRVTSPLRK
ncbi:hypothetical protein DL764_009421 [Monosporascus ibericus]|uniref:Only prolin and serin are matching in the corresponding protein n=1 Tax=Monosporascus ibericus TaxID=155417 RepID=A0A4Q4SX45_9PEZI|nr:hypothetical protein DL764_009421 [Monosporascus ibericus]